MTQASRHGLQAAEIRHWFSPPISSKGGLPSAALPEQLVFDGSLKDCIHIFSEQSIEEGSEQINAYLEQGAAEWTENGWEQFTCRTAVLGCCSGFYLSIVNKKDL